MGADLRAAEQRAASLYSATGGTDCLRLCAFGAVEACTIARRVVDRPGTMVWRRRPITRVRPVPMCALQPAPVQAGDPSTSFQGSFGAGAAPLFTGIAGDVLRHQGETYLQRGMLYVVCWRRSGVLDERAMIAVLVLEWSVLLMAGVPSFLGWQPDT